MERQLDAADKLSQARCALEGFCEMLNLVRGGMQECNAENLLWLIEPIGRNLREAQDLLGAVGA